MHMRTLVITHITTERIRQKPTRDYKSLAFEGFNVRLTVIDSFSEEVLMRVASDATLRSASEQSVNDEYVRQVEGLYDQLFGAIGRDAVCNATKKTVNYKNASKKFGVSRTEESLDKEITGLILDNDVFEPLLFKDLSASEKKLALRSMAIFAEKLYSGFDV